MPTEPPVPPQLALHVLHAWFSPAYPLGSFAYSHGLEAEVAAGRVCDADTLQPWIEDVLERGAGWTDAILMLEATRTDDVAPLAELAEALSATAGRRTETMALGRAFAATTAAAWGTDPTPMAYPVAVGSAVRVLGLPPGRAVRLMLHGFASTLVTAAVRFVPLGQTDGVRTLAALMPCIERVAAGAEEADLDDIGGCALAADLASMAQETL